MPGNFQNVRTPMVKRETGDTRGGGVYGAGASDSGLINMSVTIATWDKNSSPARWYTVGYARGIRSDEGKTFQPQI